ncbi:MAG: flagellar biosynthesis protein FlhB [Planctomycetes bacterium]|nr:flagellar biosynthesis protein FlhB [Planctomycetota bacterium]
MAADAGEKTEPATPRRRQDARKQGQVARSQDLPAAVLLLVAFVMLYWTGPKLWQTLIVVCRTALAVDDPRQLAGTWPFVEATAVEMIKCVAPILVALFLAILAVMYAQVGWLLSTKPLMPSLSKISPIAGFKRLFSVRMFVTALTNFAKLLVVGALAFLTVKGSAAAIIYAFTFEHQDVFRLGSALMFKLGIRLAAALLVLALLDVAWQRYKHERDLRMTKEEVKDELRSMEGDPKIKQRRRQVQLQLAIQRIRRDVPTADVVVTNPTHYAVAIRYDATAMVAPKVVAKGADHLALRIRQVAQEFRIPIVERAPLARALYADVEVGESIPERFYRAVAEILAYVYELTGRTSGLIQNAARGAS